MSLENYLSYFLAFLLVISLIYLIGNQIKEFHQQDDPMLHLLKDILTPIHPVISTLKLYRGDRSYTINKDRIFLCLYDDSGQYYPLNMLIYVLLHEVAHKLNEYDVGHTEAFQAQFDALLKRAEQIGVYNPNIPVINGYCGSD